MTPKTYKFLTNICFAIAIVSILLFDRFSRVQWIFGGLFLMAAAVAVSAHLYSQWHPLAARQETAVDRIGSAVQPIQLCWPEFPEEETQRFLVMARHPMFPAQLFIRQQFEYFAVSQPPLIARFDANIAVEIARKLAPAQTDFEVTLTAEGHLVIRPFRAPLSGGGYREEADSRNQGTSSYIN